MRISKLRIDMFEKPEPKNNNLTENPESQELKPEVLKEVMEKVQDILATDTAFLVYLKSSPFSRDKLNEMQRIGGHTDPEEDNKIQLEYDWEKDGRNLESVKSALQNGVLGIYKHAMGEELADEARAKYASLLKSRAEPAVYFNVIGRSSFVGEKIQDMHPSYGGFDNDKISIIFDISKYKEDAPPITQQEIDNIKRSMAGKKTKHPNGVTGNVGKTSEIPLNHFFSDSRELTNILIRELITQGISDEKSVREALTPGSSFLREFSKSAEHKFWRQGGGGYVSEDGKLMPVTEYGFALKGRVQPRNFLGMAVALSRPETEQEKDERSKKFGYETDKINRTKEEDHTKYLQRARFLASMQKDIYSSKPELIVPIYDFDGNLLWPKEMTREEIIKFVEERERRDANQQI